jgi:hypothetical protein
MLKRLLKPFPPAVARLHQWIRRRPRRTTRSCHFGQAVDGRPAPRRSTRPPVAHRRTRVHEAGLERCNVGLEARHQNGGPPRWGRPPAAPNPNPAVARATHPKDDHQIGTNSYRQFACIRLPIRLRSFGRCSGLGLRGAEPMEFQRLKSEPPQRTRRTVVPWLPTV